VKDRPGFEANPGPNYLVAGAVPAAPGAAGEVVHHEKEGRHEIDMIDPNNRCNRVLDGLGDLGFQLGGRRSELRDNHRDDRNVDARITGDRQLVEAGRAMIEKTMAGSGRRME